MTNTWLDMRPGAAPLAEENNGDLKAGIAGLLREVVE